jgi:hypothetical protein
MVYLPHGGAYVTRGVYVVIHQALAAGAQRGV